MRQHCLAVVAVAFLLAELPGIPLVQADDEVDDALRIAEEVTEEVEGPQVPHAAAPQMRPSLKAHKKVGPSSAMLQKAEQGAKEKARNANEEEHLASNSETAEALAMAEDITRAGPAPAPAAEVQGAADAKKAHLAASSAKQAAELANKVAAHSIRLTHHAKSALKNARDAVHSARVDAADLSGEQKQSLKTAEAKLREATKDAEYGQVRNAKYVKAEVENKKLQKMEEKMAKIKRAEKDLEKKVEVEKAVAKKAKSKVTSSKRKRVADSELETMRQEIKQLREQLKKKEGDKTDDDEVLQELQEQIEDMEKAEKKEDKKDHKSHDELKAEIERLRGDISDMEEDDQGKVSYNIPKQDAQQTERSEKSANDEEEREKYNVKMKPPRRNAGEEDEREEHNEAAAVEQRGIDIDTAMPYGDLEPFGREDTAQELTENSIKESNAMVDQLERAQVAEEKRAVFRALTRLRGAAITSFDGIARAQTGQIDEYNKMNRWRHTHPLHHLADEESDVSKWAFPENADF